MHSYKSRLSVPGVPSKDYWYYSFLRYLPIANINKLETREISIWPSIQCSLIRFRSKKAMIRR